MKSFKIIDETKNIINKFGPEILTGVSIIFTGLAIKAAIDKAEEAVEVKMNYRAEMADFNEITESSPDQDAVKKTLKTKKIQKNIELALVYKWAIIFGIGSAICMICSTKLSGSKLAAAYALAKLNEDKLKIALEKTKEMFGDDAEKDIQNKITEELAIKNDAPRVCTDNPNLDEPTIFIDSYTGAWFESTMQKVQSSIETAKVYLSKNHTLSYNKWWAINGLPHDACYISNIGWNVFNPFDATIEDIKIGDKTYKTVTYKNKPDNNFYHMTK